MFGGTARFLVPFPIMETRNQVSIFPCDRDAACALGSATQRWPHEGPWALTPLLVWAACSHQLWGRDGGVVVVAGWVTSRWGHHSGGTRRFPEGPVPFCGFLGHSLCL